MRDTETGRGRENIYIIKREGEKEQETGTESDRVRVRDRVIGKDPTVSPKCILFCYFVLCFNASTFADMLNWVILFGVHFLSFE